MEQLRSDQDLLYGALESHLGRHPELRRGRQLAFMINTVTVFPTSPGFEGDADQGSHFCGIDEVGHLVSTFAGVDAPTERALQGALQRVMTIKPAKKRSDAIRGSRGDTLKQIERGIANLDRWQKRAAIETPDGPQRIRGLAGSGKTIVLALKAAYLHTQHPDWRIAVTFQSRSLYQQIVDLVTRFTFEHSNDSPDFSKLQILHAWGSSSRDGVYNTLARIVDVPPHDFNSARSKYGMEDAFRGACGELNSTISKRAEVPQVFDAILIDEAQDFPSEFFQLVYAFCKQPKRIVWAFDELQKLNEAAMPSVAEMFGVTKSGDPIVSLNEADGEARRDIVLPVCYRNSPWSLAVAHAVGFGVYRPEGLVQYFGDSDLWRDVGYRVVSGQLAPGSEVTLERAPNTFPSYFGDLLSSQDAVQFHRFDNEAAQYAWVADQIRMNLENDNLEYDDILVVLPDTYTAKRRGPRFARMLAERGIKSHLAGVNSSVDTLFLKDSIAMAHIFRAKGNEAPMVYVLDSQYASSRVNAVARRNTIFTSITRSRAWVRVCGWGENVEGIEREIREVQTRDYRLTFTVPTDDELAHMRRIHRDRSDEEERLAVKASKSAEDLARALDSGSFDPDDLSPELRKRLLERLARGDTAE